MSQNGRFSLLESLVRAVARSRSRPDIASLHREGASSVAVDTLPLDPPGHGTGQARRQGFPGTHEPAGDADRERYSTMPAVSLPETGDQGPEAVDERQ